MGTDGNRMGWKRWEREGIDGKGIEGEEEKEEMGGKRMEWKVKEW